MTCSQPSIMAASVPARNGSQMSARSAFPLRRGSSTISFDFFLRLRFGLGEAIGVAAVEDEVHAFLGKRQRAAQTQPRGRGTNDGGFSLQTEVHGSPNSLGNGSPAVIGGRGRFVTWRLLSS